MKQPVTIDALREFLQEKIEYLSHECNTTTVHCYSQALAALDATSEILQFLNGEVE